MARGKVTIHVHGYGIIKVKRPKRYDDESFSDALAMTVKKTMNLVDPRAEGRFHPVYGFDRPEGTR